MMALIKKDPQVTMVGRNVQNPDKKTVKKTV